MKVAAFAGVLALGLIGAGSAFAQSWVDVGSDVVKTQYQVDSLSVKVHGKYIDSWQRQIFAKPVKLPSGKYYTVVISHRREDCAADESAGLDATFTDAKGAVVETFSVAEPNVSFRPLVPGSIGRTVHDQVCDFAKRIVALKPTVPTESLQDTDWISLGSDVQNRSDHSLARNSVQRAGDRVVFIVRSHNHAPILSANKFAYRTQYATWQLDCAASVFRVSAIDYYDDNGQLVDVSPADLKTLEFVPINPNSQAGAMKTIVCSAAAASSVAQDKGEESQAPSSGTGWLGPKGYIITASHVVGASRVVGVAQDGKIVGTAEVVVSDPANDVAILKPKLAPGVHPVIPLASEPAALGEHVFTLGYPSPDDLGLSVKMTSGEISGVKGSDVINERIDDARLLQISVPVQHGNSGGPLFDDRGQAIGIIVTGFGGASDLQNVSFALKAAYVRNLLSELPDLGGYRPLKVSASIPSLVADLRESVFMLVVVPDKDE